MNLLLALIFVITNQIEVRFDQCNFWINDHRITRELDMENMIEILGPYSRHTKQIYTWDDLGIYIYLDRSTNKLSQVNLSIFDGNTAKSNFPLSFTPKKRLKRKLLFENHSLSKKSSIEDIEALGFEKEGYLYSMTYGCHKLTLNYLGKQLGDLGISLPE